MAMPERRYSNFLRFSHCFSAVYKLKLERLKEIIDSLVFPTVNVYYKSKLTQLQQSYFLCLNTGKTNRLPVKQIDNEQV